MRRTDREWTFSPGRESSPVTSNNQAPFGARSLRASAVAVTGSAAAWQPAFFTHRDLLLMEELFVSPAIPSSHVRAHRKIAVLIPAGLVTNHDRVISYESADRTRIINARLNIGDTFVFESSLRLIRFEQLHCFNTYSQNVDEAVALLNDCDVAILRGSNYLHPSMDWGNLPEVVERSQTPVVAFGIGAQASRFEPVKLSAKAARFMAMIAERSRSIGCRGKFTASVLHDIGIKNVSSIGCPSLFRSNDAKLRISWPPPSVTRIGFTVTRGFSPGYCDDVNAATKCELEMLKKFASELDVYILSQGETAEKIFYYRAYDRINDAKKSMRQSGWDLDRRPWLTDLYWRRMFFGVSPEEYEAMVKRCDIVVGYRLHGNMMALSVGTPAIYVTYDSRTREIVDHFSIPHHDILAPRAFSLKRMMRTELFAEFNARFAVNYGLVRQFLEENSVAHKMSE